VQPSNCRHLVVLVSVLFTSACAVELIDDIIAERGVTECSTGSTTSTGSTSTGTTADASTGSPMHETSGTTSDAQETSGGQDTSGSESSSGAPPGPVCGDAVVEGEEECDDGNASNEDGCRNDCIRRWYVFITSAPSIQGDLNGITGADYECRHRATKAFLPNGERYKAWLSTSTVQPADRLYHARGPYVRLDGLQVAADWGALTSGTLEHSINVDENGETVEAAVWTGTTVAGTRIPNTQHCSDWEYGDSDQSGWAGDSTATDALWTHGVETDCGALVRLYCFEQP